MSTDDKGKVVRLPSAKTPVFDVHHFPRTAMVELRILRRPSSGKYEYAKVSLRYVGAKLVGITVYGYSNTTTLKGDAFRPYAISEEYKRDILLAIDEYREAVPWKPTRPKR